MARTLLDLARNLDKKVKKLEKASSKVAVDAALAIVRDLTRKTPVDTSRAISNWQVELVSPARSGIKSFFEGSKGSTENASAAATVESARLTLSKKKPGQIIYISSVLPYIKRLNDGYSSQAPAGFVEMAVLIGRKTVKNAKLKVT